MLRRLAFVAPLLTLLSLPTEARSLPGPTAYNGPNCRAIARATGLDTLHVGTVLGGQNRSGAWGDGTGRDYRTFQGCFTTASACEAFIARNRAHHPLLPGYARCTAVFVGKYPARAGGSAPVVTKY